MTITAEDNNTVANDVESIANEIFDTAGVTDDTELTFENNETLIVEDTTSETETETTELVDQPEKKSTIAENEQKLFAGKYKTVEELEQAYTEKAQTTTTVAPVQPVEPDVPDLNERELTLLMERDEQDGTNYNLEYFQDKIKERNLEPFEVEAIKELDQENGTNLFQDYIATSTERNVLAKIQPVLRPAYEAQQREQYNKYVEGERAINATAVVEYGQDRLDILEAKIKGDRSVVDNVLATPVGAVINNLWNNGNRALSHKLLLREVDTADRVATNNVKASKTKASVQADVGSNTSSGSKPSPRANTLEEAFDQALAEN